jgi:hypothetical protein
MRCCFALALLVTATMTQQSNVIVDDTDPRLLYTPPGAWEYLTNPAWYFRGTYHFTGTGGAAVTLRFNGSAISYYSDLNADHGRFSVKVDNTTFPLQSSYSTTASLTPGLLFSTAGLDPAMEHVITITNIDNLTTGFDYLNYTFVELSESSVASSSSHVSTTSAFPTVSTPTTSGTPAPSHSILPEVTGGLGAFVLICAVAVIGLFCLRCRRRRHKQLQISNVANSAGSLLNLTPTPWTPFVSASSSSSIGRLSESSAPGPAPPPYNSKKIVTRHF